jgi:hypothetical protein
MSGVKYDQEKPRMDLLDPLALEGLAQVLTFGAKKYATHNWRGGLTYSRLIAASLRHTYAILRGEDVDSESGLPHVDHLGCCWMFLSNMMKTRKDMDDRWKDPRVEGTPLPPIEPTELSATAIGIYKEYPVKWETFFPSDQYYVGSHKSWEQWKAKGYKQNV